MVLRRAGIEDDPQGASSGAPAERRQELLAERSQASVAARDDQIDGQYNRHLLGVRSVTSMSVDSAKNRILVVDDVLAVRRMLERVL